MKRFSKDKLKEMEEKRKVNVDDLEKSDEYKVAMKLAGPAELRRISIFYKDIYVATLSTSKGSELSTVAFLTEEGALEYKAEQEKNRGCFVEIKKVELNCRK